MPQENDDGNLKREIVIGVVVSIVTALLVVLGQLFIQLSSNTVSASIIESLSKDSGFIRAVELQLINDNRLEEKLITKLQKDIGAKMFPEKSIVAFGLKVCPSGWVEYTPAYGKFLRGIDPTGQYDTKNRVAGDYQSDSIQGHSHKINPVVSVDHGPNDKAPHGFQHGGYKLSVSSSKGVINDSNFGQARISKETRSKNVSVLFCVREKI